MKLFIINEEKPEKDISLLSLLTFPQLLVLLLHFIFTSQLYSQTIFGYFAGIVVFFVYYAMVLYNNHRGTELSIFLIVLSYYIFIVIGRPLIIAELISFGYAYKDAGEDPKGGYFEKAFMFIAVCYVVGLFVIPILLLLPSMFFYAVFSNSSDRAKLYFTMEIFFLSFLALLAYEVFAGPQITGFKIEILFVWYFVLAIALQAAALAQMDTFYHLIRGIFDFQEFHSLCKSDRVLLGIYYCFVLAGLLFTFWFGNESSFHNLSKDQYAQLSIGYFLVFTIIFSTILIAVQIGSKYSHEHDCPEQLLSEAHSSSSSNHDDKEEHLLPM